MTNNKQNIMERFNKRFPNEESGYQDKNNKYVHLFNPAVDVDDIKQFFKAEINNLLKRLDIEEKEIEYKTATEIIIFNKGRNKDWSNGHNHAVSLLKYKIKKERL